MLLLASLEQFLLLHLPVITSKFYSKLQQNRDHNTFQIYHIIKQNDVNLTHIQSLPTFQFSFLGL